VQNRWNTNDFANLRQTGSAKYLGCFRRQQSFHAAGDRGAAGGKDQHIVFDQLFNYHNVVSIMYCTGIVAAHHAGHTTDTAVNNIVI